MARLGFPPDNEAKNRIFSPSGQSENPEAVPASRRMICAPGLFDAKYELCNGLFKNDAPRVSFISNLEQLVRLEGQYTNRSEPFDRKREYWAANLSQMLLQERIITPEQYAEILTGSSTQQYCLSQSVIRLIELDPEVYKIPSFPRGVPGRREIRGRIDPPSPRRHGNLNAFPLGQSNLQRQFQSMDLPQFLPVSPIQGPILQMQPEQSSSPPSEPNYEEYYQSSPESSGAEQLRSEGEIPYSRGPCLYQSIWSPIQNDEGSSTQSWIHPHAGKNERSEQS